MDAARSENGPCSLPVVLEYPVKMCFYSFYGLSLIHCMDRGPGSAACLLGL